MVGGRAQVNVLVNGGFEAGGVLSTVNVAGSFSFMGWSGVASSSGGNAGLVFGSDNGLAPSEGSHHWTFNGGNPSDRGWIEQTFSTVPGLQYSLSVDVARSGANGQNLLLGIGVTSGGGSVLSVQAAPGASGSYATLTWSFVATGITSTLRFSDLSGGNSISDLYIDRASVVGSAVPEPSTYAALMGVVLFGAVVWERRRRRYVRRVVASAA